MDFDIKLLNEYLKNLYGESISLREYDDKGKDRINRFMINVKDYYMDMIVNGYINDDNYNYYLAKLMCLDYVEIDIDKLREQNAMSCFSYDLNGGRITTADFSSDYFDQHRGIYLDRRTFEKVIDYHELTHVLIRGLMNRANECANRIREEDKLSYEEYLKIKNNISLALQAMNEYTAEYVSNDLVTSMYRYRETLYAGGEHFAGIPYKSHLINYHMLEPLTDASTSLMFPNEKNKDTKRRNFSKMMLEYDPTEKLETLVDRNKELAIYDAYKSTMDVLNESDNKIRKSIEEYKTLKRLKRMK